jgi:DNA-binding transcriptional MerR regulator
MARAHGTLLAHDVGELVGVSGTTIGQWARRGYIKSSQRETEPRLYSVEDVAEAAIVHTLIERGVRRADIRGAAARLRRSGHPWPFSEGRVATAGHAGRRGWRPRLLFRDDDGEGEWLELTARGWQAVADAGGLREVRLRLRTQPPTAS